MLNDIRVLLVEDEPFWQENISKYIEKEAENIRVVKVVSNKEETLEFIRGNSNIDVVLVDINLTRANLDGIELIDLLSHRGFTCIALTSISDEEVIINSFELGAINYINKSSVFDIITAIQEAAEGKTNIHSDAAPALLSMMRKERELRTLTPSEQEIYILQQKGYSKKKIAEMLFKSVETVKKQIQSIKRKLNTQ